MILGLSVGQGFAQVVELPRGGRCVQEVTLSSGRTYANLVEWQADEAVVDIGMRGTTLFEGRVVGLRAIYQGFKLSVIYTDDLDRPAELVLSSTSNGSDPVRYRIGLVGYHDLEDGTRVLAWMTGFEDSTCELEF